MRGTLPRAFRRLVGAAATVTTPLTGAFVRFAVSAREVDLLSKSNSE
jgi:hypothetical protein